jgi:hypothetical protein
MLGRKEFEGGREEDRLYHARKEVKRGREGGDYHFF